MNMKKNVPENKESLAFIQDRIHTCLDREIVVQKNRIGQTLPTFIVAEGACNHMCEMSLAHSMIDHVAEAGANAVKFQTYRAERLVRQNAKSYWQGNPISQLEYYRKLDRFGRRDYEKILSYAKERDIVAFSTPFDLESATMLYDLGMELFKIASCDLPDTRLLRHIASFGKPIILSTGGSTPEEIDQAISTLIEAGARQLVVLACMLSYPTPNQNANLLRIRSLKERYPHLIIGYSDHTQPDPNMVIPALAVVLGARVVEKHFTLDRTLSGSGHSFSTDPEDLKKMVANIRLAETVLGDATLGVSELEEAARANARRSLVAERKIEKGEIIDDLMVGLKRPADGLPGCMIDQIVGKRAKCNIEADQAFSLEMVE